MEIVIEKGVPAPSNKRSFYSTLEVGDSFLIPAEEVPRVRSAASAFRQRNKGFNFLIRKLEGGTFRFWRIEPKSK